MTGWQIVTLIALLYGGCVVWFVTAAIAAPLIEDVEDLAWEQHCDQALALARDGYTDEAIAAADLLIWQMELCYCGECQDLYAAIGCAP